MSKQILLYKAGSGLSSADLVALREAGFVPIRVKDLNDVRVLDPLAEAAHTSVVLQSAMKAIIGANKDIGCRTLFGQTLAEKLLSVGLPQVKRG